MLFNKTTRDKLDKLCLGITEDHTSQEQLICFYAEDKNKEGDCLIAIKGAQPVLLDALGNMINRMISDLSNKGKVVFIYKLSVVLSELIRINKLDMKLESIEKKYQFAQEENTDGRN